MRTGLWLTLVVLCGCARGGPVPVHGTVKLDGKPLAEATVQFLSQDSEGRDAMGFTNSAGKFELSTYRPRDGALPGKYKVVIQSASATDTGPAVASPTEAQQAPSRSKAHPVVNLPAQYSRSDQTILTEEVPVKGAVVLELQSK